MAVSERARGGLGLEELNRLSAEAAEAVLLHGCTSPRWAAAVAMRRPYASIDDLLTAADEELAALDESDIDAALAGHPRIGDAPSGTGSEQSRGEQSRVSEASGAVRAALVEGNRAYEERFGHVYLVSASGRTAEDLLQTLRQRLGNDPATERRVLREELRRINRLRLQQALT